MVLRICGYVLFVTLVFNSIEVSRCFAQIGFKELIEAGLEERAKLEAYSFTYRSAHRVQDLFVVFEEGAIVGMPKKNLWYTKRKAEGAWLVQPANGQEIRPNLLLGGDEVHTIHRNGTSYRAKRGRGISPTEVKTDTPLSGPTEPFDFRYFGLAYEGDISTGKTYEKIMETYRTFPDVKQTKLEFLTGEQDGCVEVHFVWNRLIVDLKKGHWPVSLKAMGSKLVLGEFEPKVIVQTDIELINKFDHWWPKHVVVTDATGDSREIFFEWKDPKTVEEAMFDPSLLIEIAKFQTVNKESSGPEIQGK